MLLATDVSSQQFRYDAIDIASRQAGTGRQYSIQRHSGVAAYRPSYYSYITLLPHYNTSLFHTYANITTIQYFHYAATLYAIKIHIITPLAMPHDIAAILRDTS